MIKKGYLLFILIFLTVFCYGQSNFSRGEDLFMRNNPSGAVSLLERALAEDPSNVLIYIYLGVTYEQLERNDEAIAVYRRILPSAGNHSANIANNLGNLYFKRGNIEEAERFYTQALGFNPIYSISYLARGNTRIRSGDLSSAILDYEQYLTLEPRSAQRTNIELVVNLIRSEAAADAIRREIAAEEERRLAAERQALLDSVSASLQSAADQSQGISTGAESVEHYDGEFELD
ncbi:MAG: tetratricopeptide repeat protein [Treponema sp.]|nr:tetratricopeptide repeat protein [Treponema sp.]